MWIISEERAINLDNVWKIWLSANSSLYNDSCLIFENFKQTILECNTFENAKEMLKDINQAIYDGKKTFNFDAHLSYIEKRRKSND